MHGKWRVEPEDGGQVEATALALQPVDPVIYAMKDVWGFDDDGEDWYADGAKKRKKEADDDQSAAASSSSNTSKGPFVEGAGMTLGCVLVAGILIGAAAMRLRQAKRRPPPTVELGQVIVAEEIPKDLEPTRILEEPSPEVHSVDASTPTARPV